MLATDGVKADVFAHVAIQHELDAALLQLIVAAHHDVLFKFEAGNAVGQQATRPVVAVIDRHLHARTAQHIRRCQPTGSGADDADGLITFHRGDDGFHPALLPRGVGDIFLDRANGDCAVTGLLDDAIPFAETVLRADASADLGEGIGGLADLVCFLQAALRSQAQPVRDVVVQRTVRLAVGHATLAAPTCLLLGLGVCVFGIDFIEVLAARLRLTLFRHVAFDRDEFQHRLLGHGETPIKSGLAPSKPRQIRLKVSSIDLIYDFFRCFAAFDAKIPQTYVRCGPKTTLSPV